jgi:carbamoyl-phosphate synthase large subunit
MDYVEKLVVLMTGAGAPGAAGIIKCLKQDKNIHLILADAAEEPVGKYLNGNFYQIPAANDPDFIPAVRSICLKEQVKIIMPLVTRELFAFSSHKDEFRTIGVHVLVSDESALSIANDKGRLYQHLEQARLKVPKYKIINTWMEFEEALEYLDYPNQKVCFKPCISNGSRGFRIIDPAIDEFHLLFKEKPNHTFTSVEKLKSILENQSFPTLLVSEYLPGPEFSVDCIAKNGQPVVVVPRVRSRMKEGISVAGEFIQHKEIIKYCEDIIKSLHLHGNIGIQVKQAVDGEYKILEINPRVQGTISAGLGAGINLPLLAIYQEANIPIDEHDTQVIWGTKFIRFWQEVFYN